MQPVIAYYYTMCQCLVTSSDLSCSFHIIDQLVYMTSSDESVLSGVCMPHLVWQGTWFVVQIS